MLSHVKNWVTNLGTGETTLEYRYHIYVEISATSPAGVGPWKLDGGTKWHVSTTGSFGCSCELCQGAAHVSPFLLAQVELGWPPLLALGREQPVSDDHRVSVPSHPDLGASVLHWEQGAEEGVLGRRVWFGREDGVALVPCIALWLSVAAGWL